MEGAVPEPQSEELSLVGGRYRLDDRIARGGMGSVYRAFDQSAGKPIALKRLRVQRGDRRGERMFEREYHTLAGLEHPRIIEVYDYGVDDDGPYYTMELLDGRDLREMAPVPYEEACRHLRDVASSLALLHARRLLHRDLSPRNVRITSDGRAKLIDFGALAAFGNHSTVVGTPPCIPPEAIHGGLLDQRADLYSLGALAYWVLTGRHAFDVRVLGELSSAWKREPKPPSELAIAKLPEHPIPPELDELVQSLLSRNPLARPSSAAEVISRLSAIAELPPDSEPLSALSYLRGGKTVGRGRQRAQLRKRLKSAASGKGSAVLITAESGMGAARILADLALEAQLMGATPVVIDANRHRGSYGVAHELARVLHEQLPKCASETIKPFASELPRFLPGSEGRSSATMRILTQGEAQPADPREARLRTQEALRGWLNALTEREPLLLAVRNIQRADDASASLLATLAHGIGERKLLMVATRNRDEQASAPAAIDSLRDVAARMRLSGLSRREVVALVEATFGEVANTERLADWLHGLTGGKPQECLDLIHHLVAGDVIQFADGVWALPQELSPTELPADLGQAMCARLDRLGKAARTLAAALSIHRGPIALEQVLRIAEREGVLEPLVALDELEREDVLGSDAQSDSYYFSHSPVREALESALEEGERKRLHAELGALLAADGGEDPGQRLDAGWHLLHGGEEERGAALLAEMGQAMAYNGDEIPAAIPALEAALEVMRSRDRPAREIGPLLGTLAVAGFYADRRVLESYGPEAIDLLEDVIGLRVAARVRPWLGRKLSLLVGLASAFFAFVPVHGLRGAGAELARLITLYSTSITVTVGLGTLTLDGPFAQQFVPRLEHLAALGEHTATGLNYKMAQAVSKIPEDRVAQVLREIGVVIEALEQDGPIPLMPDETRKLMLGAALYTQGSLETFRETPVALEIADRIEGMGWKVFSLFANQIRANYHALRGELDRAEHFREQVELCAIQAGSGWQAEVWSGSGRLLGYRVTGDVIGLKRLVGELERLAREIPSLSRHAGLAKAGYLLERGDHVRSHAIGEPIWKECEPREYIGWGSTVAGRIRNSSSLIGLQESVEVGRWALSLYDAEDRQVCAMLGSLVAELGVAEARVGDIEGGARRIEDYLQELGDRGGPATRGLLHMARARVAILAEDLLTARVELAHMDRWYRPTGNPALVAKVEQLRREIEGSVEQPPDDDLLNDTLDLGQADLVHVRTMLEQCEGRQQRLEKVLAMLVKETRGASGYLFLSDGDSLELAAPEHGAEPPGTLIQRLEREISQFTQEEEETVATATTGINTQTATEAFEPERYRTFLLSMDDTSIPRVVGAVAIKRGKARLRAPVQGFLSGVAEGLVAAGDVPG